MNLREYATKQTNGAEGSANPATGTPAQGTKQQPLPDRYKRIYRAVYDFHARHAPAPQTLEEWEAFADDIGKTAAAGGNDPFITALLKAVADEFERQYKNTETPEDSF